MVERDRSSPALDGNLGDTEDSSEEKHDGPSTAAQGLAQGDGSVHSMGNATPVESEEREDDGSAGVHTHESGEQIRLGNDTLTDKKQKRDMSEPLEDQLTNEKLKQLEEIFEAADEDGGGGLDMEEFRKAMRTQLGNQVTDAELDKIFMKVDTNCDGTVDWDEYLTYMLLECGGKDTMNIQARQPFPRYVNTVRTPHRDSVVRLLFVSSGRSDKNSSRYVSVSKEGVVCFWDLALKPLSTYRIQKPGKSIWVTDTVYIPILNALVVATTSRDLVFFDISASRFTRTCVISKLNACALSLDFCCVKDPVVLCDGRPVKSLMTIGDARGGVVIILFHTDPQMSPFNCKLDNKKRRTKVTFPELLLNRLPGVSATYRPDLHNDIIAQIMYCQPLNSVISCCKEMHTAMYVSGLESKTYLSAYFKVKKGVNTFDYCQSLNVIVTGGYDGFVRVWNPYVSAKPISRLTGHQFPVLHVSISQAREHSVSISENKEIRVHDLTTQTCIQTIYKKMIQGLGSRPISAMLLNQSRQALLFATSTLACLEHQEEERRSQELVSHTKRITGALYNPLFEQVVSVGSDSLVCVWNITTGEKVMQFKAHRIRHQGQSKDVEVTAMVFDPTFRRLITASRTGVVRLWNFNNGACLRELPCIDHDVVTTVVCPSHRILTAGWNRRIAVYMDQTDDDSVRWLKGNHRNDILTMDQYNNQLVASASYDGNILVWSLTTGRLLYCLNARKSRRPLRAASYLEETLHLESINNNNNHGTNLAAAKSSTVPGRDGSPPPSSATTVPGRRAPAQLPPIVGGTSGGLQGNGPTSRTAASKADGGGGGSGVGGAGGGGAASCAIEKLLFLQAREKDAETAVLLAGTAHGTVQAWSLHQHGGLLGEFPAGRPDRVGAVVAMATDEENTLAAVGSSAGYLALYDIGNYHVHGWRRREADPAYVADRAAWYSEFPFVRYTQAILDNITCDCWIRDYYKEGNLHPTLLSSYRAHIESISSVALTKFNGATFLMTSSSDRSIRMWTLQGQFIGIFGQTNLWDQHLIDPSMPKLVVPKSSHGAYRNRRWIIPSDVRRVGSATTLTVLNCGRNPAWKLCTTVIKWLVSCKQSSSSQTDASESEAVLDASHQSSSALDAQDDSEDVSSSILGRSYRRLTHHRPLPEIRRPRFNGTSQVLSVYSCMKFHALEPIKNIPAPEHMRQTARKKVGGVRAFKRESLNVQRKLGILKHMRRYTKLLPKKGTQTSSNLLTSFLSRGSESPHAMSVPESNMSLVANSAESTILSEDSLSGSPDMREMVTSSRQRLKAIAEV